MAARYFLSKFFEFFEELERKQQPRRFLKNKSRYETSAPIRCSRS